MAYTLGNKCAKNLCKRTVLYINLSSKTWSHVFLEHSVFIITPKQQTVDRIIEYNITQHNHHKSRKELIYTVIDQIKIWV